MGKLGRFQIVLDRPDGVYYAGEVVSGTVHIEVKENLKFRGLKAEYRGLAHTRVSSDSSSSDDEEEEYYFSENALLYGRDKDSSGMDVTLNPGEYRYTWSFTLPHTLLPSSFEWDKGNYVRYFVRIVFDIPMRFDKSTKKIFTVIRHYDMNKEGDVLEPQRHQAQKTLGCLCCTAGYLDLWGEMPRKGYVPGEVINFRGEAQNHSTRNIDNASVEIVQKMKAKAKGSKATSTRVLAKMRKMAFAPGQHCTWHPSNDKLVIPPCVPTGLEGCSLIDIMYYLHVEAEPSGMSLSLDFDFDLKIGTIPNNEALAMEQYQPRQQQPFAGAVNFPVGYSLPVNAPPPSYEGCSLGGVQSCYNDEQEKKHSDPFTPRYLYYGFERMTMQEPGQ